MKIKVKAVQVQKLRDEGSLLRKLKLSFKNVQLKISLGSHAKLPAIPLI